MSGEEQDIIKDIEDIKRDIAKIRDNELVHIEGRISDLEQSVRPPLTTFFLGAAFAVFIAVVGFVMLPSSVGWPLLVVCVAIVAASLFGIWKSTRGKNDS